MPHDTIAAITFVLSSSDSDSIAFNTASAVIFAFVVNKIFVFRSLDWSAKVAFRECWQFVVARLFSQNLKTRYDPSKGEDAKIEELCKIWDSGQWDPFYYSIFMEAPRKTVIQQETLDSEVRKKNR